MRLEDHIRLYDRRRARTADRWVTFWVAVCAGFWGCLYLVIR